MSRPGRQRLGIEVLHAQKEIKCSHCSMRFKHLFEMDLHLKVVHGLNRRARERVYVDMKIAWYQNYSPPGWWVTK